MVPAGNEGSFRNTGGVIDGTEKELRKGLGILYFRIKMSDWSEIEAGGTIVFVLIEPT